jgi:hypothetical protein
MLLSHAERLIGLATPARAVVRPWWAQVASRLGAARALWREAACGLGGHAMILHVEPQRLSLQCMECGHNTPGWKLDRGAR